MSQRKLINKLSAKAVAEYDNKVASGEDEILAILSAIDVEYNRIVESVRELVTLYKIEENNLAEDKEISDKYFADIDQNVKEYKAKIDAIKATWKDGKEESV